MAWSRRTKFIVWGIAGTLLIGFGCFIFGFLRAWDNFMGEDRIAGSFEPVIDAIDHFQEKTGTTPTNLTQLVPVYLPKIPGSPVAESIDYRIMSDRTNWQLTVHSRITGQPRVFIRRSSNEFSPTEKKQSVNRFHGWTEFKEKE